MFGICREKELAALFLISERYAVRHFVIKRPNMRALPNIIKSMPRTRRTKPSVTGFRDMPRIFHLPNAVRVRFDS